MKVTTALPEWHLSLLMSLESSPLNSLKSNLILVRDNSAAHDLSESIKTLHLLKGTTASRVFSLPGYETSPYLGLQLPEDLVFQRLQWLYQAQFCQPGDVFIASLAGISQHTLPLEVLLENSFEISQGDELPENLDRQLRNMGYRKMTTVEGPGSYASRGGILDVFSPAHSFPVRMDLFGDEVESLRSFDAESQRSLNPVESYSIIPASEILLNEESLLHLGATLDQKGSTGLPPDLMSQLRNKQLPPELPFLLPYSYKKCSLPKEFLPTERHNYFVEPVDSESHFESSMDQLRNDQLSEKTSFPEVQELFTTLEESLPKENRVHISRLEIDEDMNNTSIQLKVQQIKPSPVASVKDRLTHLQTLVERALAERVRVVITGESEIKKQKAAAALNLNLEEVNFNEALGDDLPAGCYFLKGRLPISLSFTNENLLLLHIDDFLSTQKKVRSNIQSELKKAKALSFGDLSPGDFVIHSLHGVARYEGLKVMDIGGAEAEFLELSFKDKDKLFLPIYRLNQVNKFASSVTAVTLDRLGGKQWEKTRAKTQKRLREIADELVRLYAARKNSTREPHVTDHEDILNFVNEFPFEDTADQSACYQDILEDFSKSQPMDRLICGDVGFGKTEMSMRAAFVAAFNKKQVLILAPTTLLTFQHFESFKKRFANWPLNIRVLNRFVPRAEAKKTLQELNEGKVDILIGTHRLLSKDIQPKNPGLLIIDEEQKFGVKHKEKIRQLRHSIDTLAMSATPIPRTLNMSLLGLRDLSLINTPPHNRLPVRTYVSKSNMSLIQSAVENEIKRGGQIFFLHNKVQSIYSLAEELRDGLKGVRIAVAHGQLDERQLEDTMISFLNKEIDLLLCTTIIESGIDIPNANTIFVDKAQSLGLSQLYQLRGRVGRSRKRAFCYLLVPPNGVIDNVGKERLRILQQNSSLGSGIQVAQYDLELRGAGTLLGEEQSGLVDAVGYELYIDLLEQAVNEAKGTPMSDQIEPEVNLRVRALIPQKYMPDIKQRLSFYKALSSIKETDELDQIEADLRDQFGTPPEEIYNLLGIMMLRLQCKKLGIKDVSAGVTVVSLSFTNTTPLSSKKIVELSMMPNKKYSLTPDNRLKIRMKDISWQNISQELDYLKDHAQSLV